MRKLFTILFSLLLSSVLTEGFAQRNLLMWNNGYVSVVSSASVDSITFSNADGLFLISTSPATNVGPYSFSVSGSVQLAEGVKGLSKTPSVGVCYSSDNAEPLADDDTLALAAGFGEKSATFAELTPGTTYNYRLYVRLFGETYYGNVCSVTTSEVIDHSKTVNGHRFVDLGLPSGILWAETNVGATSAEEAGDYFAWGETGTKTEYTESNSAWYGQAHADCLTAEEDAATAVWGDGTRMPTRAEMEELCNNCTWTAATVNDVAGYKVVSKTNGNEIFLPSAGYRTGETLSKFGETVSYWCSTPSGDKAAYCLATLSGRFLVGNYYRYFGRPVRAVAE